MELNNQYIGSFIKFMRQRAGLTQQELAERTGVGSKTISKWEQGRGIPDISLLYSLSLELDVDIESLLAGNLEDIGKEWIGIIYVGEAVEPDPEERDWECMVSMFLLAGIRDIAVFGTNGECKKPEDLLRRYCDKGFLQRMCCTDSAEELARYVKTEKKHICFLYRPAFLYGMNLTRYMRRAMLGKEIKALALRQGRESFMPVVCFDNHFSCVSVGEGADSDWHLFPMLFGRSKCIMDYLLQLPDRQVNITSDAVWKHFAPLSVEIMERGMLAFSFETKRARTLAKQVLSGIEESQNIKIGNLEEIMKVRGWK